MRCETWIRAVMLSIATLGSGSILAAEVVMVVPTSDAAGVQVQAAKRAPAKHVRKRLRADVDQKDATKVVPAVASTPALPVPDGGSALTQPAKQDEVLPADNRVQPLALKGVRG